ncbi:phosphatase 2A regulatory subunit-related protein, putative [Plasmodium vinckei brucechwatti]|uniref:Phosphatase 2A regulatory subunit-related protein, putative n=1 Tax=Plasmodium vinckei brucechwatti TaxID=119398 RepID=A0A6V7SCD9_PLAVN|nr:phosphatase 2A regulatory subunit-related protein, putative [Plasmodium vinckei brucechwatti]
MMNLNNLIKNELTINEKANSHFKENISGTSKKANEINEMKALTSLIFKSELMRKFLMDENVWIFIQNMKRKLKEDSVGFDTWLDDQLIIAKANSETSINADIIPLVHHAKNNYENVSSKCDKEYDGKYYPFVNHDNQKNNKVTIKESLENEIGIKRDEDKFDFEGVKNKLIKNIEKNETDDIKICYRNNKTKNDNLYLKETEKTFYDKMKNDLNNMKKLLSDEEKNKEIKNINDNINNIDGKNIFDSYSLKRYRAEIASDESKNGAQNILESKGKLPTIFGTSTNIKNDIHNNNEFENKFLTDSITIKKKDENDPLISYKNMLNGMNNQNSLKNMHISNNESIEKNEKKNYINEQLEHKFDDKISIQLRNKLINHDPNFDVHKKEEYKETNHGIINMSLRNSKVTDIAGTDIENKIIIKNAKREVSPINLNKNLENDQRGSNEFKTTEISSTKHDKSNNENNHILISIPKTNIKIGREINEDTSLKLKKIFSQCNNKMNLEDFEDLIVVNFLKIGRYMSHTLFSKIEKINKDFVTYQEVQKYFSNRFIDGINDPSYYNDQWYVALFENKLKGTGGPPSNNINENDNTHKNGIDNIDSIHSNGVNQINSYESDRLNDTIDILDESISNSKNKEHIDVPYKKCSIINFFNAIKSDINKDYLEFKDFDLYLREILKRNKSLHFLLEHSEFLERYIESVIVRIFYNIDINDTNKIYLNDFRKHTLAHIWCSLDDSIRVQHIKQYFSYSHFYVYYCTFCQTSSCKDMLIDDNDLYRFDNHSLNDFIVNRIWSRISIKLGGPNQKYMCLNDWIYFLTNYEDMTTNRSIEFWFKLIDLDGDCVIRDHEIKVFFNIQMERLKSHYLEEPKFEDWLCQMNDAIQPTVEGNFTLSDLKKNKKYAARFFGCLVSLSKLLAWESRDVHKELQIETEYPQWTPWEIFCKIKYDELCYIENESFYDTFDNYDNYDSKNIYTLGSD